MKAAEPRGWPEPAAMLLLTVLWLAATAWARPLNLPDEGRYVGVAWEMLRSGEWLIPTLNGLPYFHKPPLFYWITAGSMSIFGAGDWAARAAPILGGTVGAFALVMFTRRWVGARAAWVTLLVLLAHPLWTVGGQFANMDMLVAGCITATIVLLAHAALSLQAGLPHRRALAGAYAMAGLGVLAKGLIGAVLPALVLLLWLILLRRWRTLAALIWAPGILLFMLIAAPWFVAVQLRFDDFLNYFFVVQHFNRFAAGGFNSVQPIWFFPVALLLFTLPWLPWVRRLFRAGALSQPGPGPLRLLMWIWLVVVVAFFSLPKSKLLGYVLPAVPPLAYLIADAFLVLVAPTRLARRLWWGSAGLACALSVGAVAGFALFPRKSARVLADALLAQRAPNEPVFMLGHYFFDLPFYARLREPVAVVDEWGDPQTARQDNWRKELADAGRFAPLAAEPVLLTPAAFVAALCAGRTAWVVGSPAVLATYPFLAGARLVASTGSAGLWAVDRPASGMTKEPGCGRKPNADSAHM